MGWLGVVGEALRAGAMVTALRRGGGAGFGTHGLDALKASELRLLPRFSVVPKADAVRWP